MKIPINPMVASWNWFSYWCSSYPAYSVAVATLSGIGSGYLLSKADQSFWFFIPAAITALLSALPPSATAYWDRKNDLDEDATAARERVMDQAIPPLLEEACQLSTSRSNQRVVALKGAAQIVTKDLIAAYSLVPNVRAAVYQVSDDGKKMTVLARAGRNQKPQPFVRGTTRGDQAFKVLAMTENFEFVADLSEAPSSWEGSGKGYKTYISAPIRVGDSGYGMLTLDAPKVGDLDSRDGSTVSLLAATLSIYFSEATRTTRNLS
ncbi:GAF domain-containing protein [Glutamicibacter sp. NPDC087831]|uniref:GAF domain-containing protein n=1 Tax=Glutamicibacter sp. NPDC087831 TaxID=3363998 RepID=UPI00380182F0